MAFPEYRLSEFQEWFRIRESNHRAKWSVRKEKSAIPLEEEIHSLRLRLEQLVKEDENLSSPEIVELSMLLDDKINEYMKRGRRDRK